MLQGAEGDLCQEKTEKHERVPFKDPIKPQVPDEPTLELRVALGAGASRTRKVRPWPPNNHQFRRWFVWNLWFGRITERPPFLFLGFSFWQKSSSACSSYYREQKGISANNRKKHKSGNHSGSDQITGSRRINRGSEAVWLDPQKVPFIILGLFLGRNPLLLALHVAGGGMGSLPRKDPKTRMGTPLGILPNHRFQAMSCCCCLYLSPC